MASSDHVFDVTGDVDRVVVQRSHQVPVLVDFWAAWCAPCRMLMPVLARLAEEYAGQFVLAKVNSDEQQELAARYGVRSLPTVKLFKNGVVVDEFMGALPESQVRAFLDAHIERESDRRMAEAVRRFRAGERDAALAMAAQASAGDPHNARVATQYLALLVEDGRVDAADAFAAQLSAALQAEPAIKALVTRLEFLRGAREAPERAVLEQRVAAAPDDLTARMQLALRLAAGGDYEPAVQQLLEVMRRNRNFQDGAAHKLVLKIFEVLGGQGEIVARYRGQLARLLY